MDDLRKHAHTLHFSFTSSHLLNTHFPKHVFPPLLTSTQLWLSTIRRQFPIKTKPLFLTISFFSQGVNQNRKPFRKKLWERATVCIEFAENHAIVNTLSERRAFNTWAEAIPTRPIRRASEPAPRVHRVRSGGRSRRPWWGTSCLWLPKSHADSDAWVSTHSTWTHFIHRAPRSDGHTHAGRKRYLTVVIAARVRRFHVMFRNPSRDRACMHQCRRLSCYSDLMSTWRQYAEYCAIDERPRV